VSVTVRDLPDLWNLTATEERVLALLAQGLSNRGIAERLVVTETAVEKHVGNVLWKVTGFFHGKPGYNRRVLAALAYANSRRP
jgi:FixJ family two-component response regulator